MELLAQRILDGLANGAIYSSMALAVVVTYLASGTVNMAKAAIGMFCAFIAWKLSDPSGLGFPVLLALPVAVAVGLAIGAALERVVVRSLEDAHDHLPIIVVTIGLFLAVSALAGTIFTTDTVRLDSAFPDGGFRIADINFTYFNVGLIATVLAVSVVMWALFHRTSFGLSMRAAVDNPESAQLVGIARGRMLMIAWALACGLSALAAVLIAPVTLVNTTMMNNILFFGFAAAALGGFDSPVGAIVGGLIMGVIESLAPAYVPFIDNQLALTATFVVMLTVLLVRPSGLFGRQQVARL